MTDVSEPRTGTAQALIAAALRLFGEKGFAATSTREIAAAADTNIASIAYYFGGKEGLLEACLADVARQLPAAAVVASDHSRLSPGEAQSALETVVRTLISFFLTTREAQDVVRFILRQLIEASDTAIDTLYEKLFEPKHRELCQLWAIATGQDPESEQTRLAVFSTIGQIIYFRIGLPMVTRRMAWDTIDRNAVEAITATVIANLRAATNRKPSE